MATQLQTSFYILLIVCSAFHIAAGAQYLVVMSNLQNLPDYYNYFIQFNFFFQGNAGLYIGVGCFSIIVCLFLLFYKNKSIEGINASYYLTLLTMCLQASVAVYSAINATNSDIFIDSLHVFQNPLIDNQVNTIDNETLAQAVVTFVVELPILFYLMFARFKDWEERVFAVKYSSQIILQTPRQPIIS